MLYSRAGLLHNMTQCPFQKRLRGRRWPRAFFLRPRRPCCPGNSEAPIEAPPGRGYLLMIPSSTGRPGPVARPGGRAQHMQVRSTVGGIGAKRVEAAAMYDRQANAADWLIWADAALGRLLGFDRRVSAACATVWNLFQYSSLA